MAVVTAGLWGFAPPPAEAAAHAACRGPEALDNYLGLASGRKISIRLVKCGAARASALRRAAAS